MAQQSKDLQELSAELARSKAELQSFAYIVSHDLREPLRSISGFSRLLQRKLGATLEPEAQQYLEFINDGTRRLQELIDGLADYARASAAIEQPRPVVLDQVVAKVLTQLAVVIHDSGAQVDADALPQVEGDPLRLTQLFRNLIANALKFRSDAPPRIRVYVEDAGEQWRLAVADNGIGIDPKHAQRVFEVFQRLHAREEYPGTGIGLALCRKIVESHGGRIWMESQAGKGATVFFTLPKAAEPPAAAPDDPQT